MTITFTAHPIGSAPKDRQVMVLRELHAELLGRQGER